MPVQSILRWAQTWDAPDYYAQSKAPKPPVGRSNVGYNTENRYFDQTDVRRGVRIWRITMEDILKLSNILHTLYDWEKYGQEFRPLREFFANKFTSPFVKEVVLTNRLVVTVFNDLLRCQNFIDRHRRQVANWYPPAFTPTYTEVGAACVQTETELLSHSTLPDRSTIGYDDRPRQVTNRPPTRLPGDVKCAAKFQASWREYTIKKNVTEGNKVLAEEYIKVASQLNYYMDDVRDSKFTETGRYGYIITDEEVVLIKREVTVSSRGQRYRLSASQGFPLRRGKDQSGPVPDTYISGMLALVYIHILAGCSENGERSYFMTGAGHVDSPAAE